MSARKLNASSSRRCVHASTSSAASTTSVVSPYAWWVSTNPGSPSKLTSKSPGRSEGDKPAPRKMRSIFRGYSGRYSPDLIGRRHAGLDLLLEADDPLDERLRPRRAAGDVDVDGDDLVHPLEHGVVVEHPARARAGAHRDHPLRLEHLVVDLAQRRRHLVCDAAGADEQIGLARRRA